MSSEPNSRGDTAAHIRHLMETEGEAVADNTRLFNDRRYDSFDELGEERHDQLRERARSIKEDAIERLPELIEQLTERVEQNGGTVYVADDAADANQYIETVCRDADAETVVKSKSMTSEEIAVNDALEDAGIDPVETDLGELVIQIADEEPSHIVGPGLHKSREDIAELFNEHFDHDEPLETAEELTAFARDHLAERIDEANVGMTGANFLAADTGTMALITNEGNARKVVEATDTHIAVAGVEKIVPSLEDIATFVQLVARSGTGQAITSYTSLFSPPVDTPPVEADKREFHLVLIDNGRMDMREDDQLRETLYCVRCSACLNSCANFQSVGGHAFGGETYTGGIATGWEAGVHGQESAAEFNDLCTGCSRCVNQCPVKIDIPWINTVVRDRINRGKDPATFDHLVDGLTPDEEPAGMDLGKRFFGNFETMAKLGSATAPVSNWLANLKPNRLLMERVLGIDSRRELPSFERETFREWFEARETTDPDDPIRRAVCYPDLYTNYVDPGRGKAAVRTLEALGVAVEMPPVRSSGRAPLSQGMVETAGEHAEAVCDRLRPYIEANYDVVVIEPSDLAMFKREYEKLVDTDDYDALAENSYEIMEYVYGLRENGADLDALATGGDEQVFYHSHCQQRTLGLEPYTTAILEDCEYDITTSETECCGMAGSFGYKNEYYELSMEVGSRLKDQHEDAGVPAVASGTSCQDQLADLSGDRPPHPIELIDPTYT
ncbi:LUD domain-containing protein [Natronolimnobius sp. AArcel1]|uniref:LUD domain-containing protein n=1 Tax=Natronolimnobius sp. AArcel1 TaxID=1679093 RepID=UPI0013E9B04E|nr:LUD domain-containing protein [Natronolimnobius sp. AArcel1]NGM67962.1 LUD domain-containing protein [Natronolimnobius sp. AArcel1]